MAIEKEKIIKYKKYVRNNKWDSQQTKPGYDDTIKDGKDFLIIS